MSRDLQGDSFLDVHNDFRRVNAILDYVTARDNGGETFPPVCNCGYCMYPCYQAQGRGYLPEEMRESTGSIGEEYDEIMRRFDYLERNGLW